MFFDNFLNHNFLLPKILEVAGLAFITAFISGVMVSITLRLYRLSRNYRYVMRVLSKEKKDLKVSIIQP